MREGTTTNSSQAGHSTSAGLNRTSVALTLLAIVMLFLLAALNGT